MGELVKLHYDVPGDDFTRAGEASSDVKKKLKTLGIDPGCIRKVAIAMYEGEINMVIHAHGGTADVEVTTAYIDSALADQGPGIPDVALAMTEGFSTAPEEVRNLGFGAGMGLPNMKKYTDDIRIETELGVGTTVYMRVNIA